MAGRNLTDDDVKALGKEIAAAVKAGGGGGNTGGGGSSGAGSSAKQNEFFDTLKNKSMEALTPVAVFGKGLEGMLSAVNAGKDAFRDLSKSGASFNNDIIGMTVAAAGTRMPLKDFAEVIKTNASEFATLGAGVTRGAEAFARMSKSFMDSGAADSLKQLGYTNKDLNEVLALQAITLRGRFKDEQSRDAVAIESATKLATEMDLMAKLTGKSREAQAESMKKAQMDMQFEASIRLKTQGMSAEEAAKFEANARSQLRDAELRGQGQMFKEVFATGQIMSKEAATQAALNQEQAAATTRQAKISADRSLDSTDRETKAREAGREAQRAAVADMNNTAKLNMMALGDAGGVASQALNKSAADQITYTRSLENVARANNLDLKNKEDLIKAQKLLEEENKKAQSGKDAEGKQVDGATKAMIQFENRMQGVNAAMTEALLKPLNEQIGPGLGQFAKTYLSGDIGGRRDAEVYREAAARGRGENAPARPQVGGFTGAAITAIEGTGAVYQGGLEAAKKGIGVVNQAGEPKKRSGGTIGMTGNLFEELGSIIEITKPDETVMNFDQMKNMARGMLDKGAEKALSGLRQLTPTSATPTIDLAKISQDITTSFSSAKNFVDQASNKIDSKQPQSFDEFAGLDEAIAKMSQEMKAGLPFDEFAGLDEAIAKQQTPAFDEFAGLDEAIAKVSTDINTAISPAIAPMSKADQAQSAIDEAIKIKDEALAEFNKMLNEGSDEELDAAYERFTNAKDNLAKVVDNSMSDLTGSFDSFGSNWSDSVDQVSEDIKTALPFDEFAGLDEAIAKQKYEDMGEFAGVDEAIAKQKALNDQPFDEFAGLDNAIRQNQEDDEAKAELARETKRGPALDSRLQDAVEAASPTQSGGFNLDSLSFGAGGKPVIKQIKSAAASIPEKKQPSPGKKINPETGEEYTPVEELEKQRTEEAKKGSAGQSSSAKPSSVGGKDASLNDVVTALNSLNTKMGQLITKTEDLFSKQINATKSNSNNIYARS